MASIFYAKGGSLKSFLAVCILTIFVYLLIFLKVPIATQIVSLIYFTFVPGALIIGIIGLDNLDNLEKILYSVGLSVVFLMGVVLIINLFIPCFGVSKPLSLELLSLSLCSLILFLAFVNYRKNGKVVFLTITRGFWRPVPILILTLIPALSIVGALFVNIYGSNWVLLVTVIIIAGVFTAVVVSRRWLPKRYYSIALFAVSFALIFHWELITNYIRGADIHLEYYVFRLTQTKLYWDPFIFFGTTASELDMGRYHSMLSITSLPTAYSNLLGLDATWVLKIVFPLLFVFVPIGFYKMWETNLGKKFAFISAFILVSEQTFFMVIPTMARQVIGELFFVLLFLVIFSKKLNSSAKMICFIIFGFALVVSHYALALIFLFFLLLNIFFDFARKKTIKIKFCMMLLFSVILFSWYFFVNWSATYISITLGFRNLIESLNEFFNPYSRGEGVLTGIGVQLANVTTLQMISRIFAYAVEVLIVIGFLALIAGRIGRKVDVECKYAITVSMFILAFSILLPSFALSMQISRFFHISLFFLAPMFIYGCAIITRLFFKRNVRNRIRAVTIIVVAIIVPYFLFQTNFIYEVTGHKSWSVPLSIYRMGVRPYTTEFCYVQEADVNGAKWLNMNLDVSGVKIYADDSSIFNVLTSYGMVPRRIVYQVEILSNTTVVVRGGIVFLSRMNVENGLYSYGTDFFNQSAISPILNFTNTIYTNGHSEIRTKP